MSEKGRSTPQRKVETTDLVFWVWPRPKARINGSNTLIASHAPPYCRVHIRVFMAIHKTRRYVDLVQILEMQSLEGHHRELPKWVDDTMISKFIDTELKRRFPDDAISRTPTTVIDKEVSKLRAIQSNYTFVAPSGVQPQLARPLVGTG